MVYYSNELPTHRIILLCCLSLLSHCDSSRQQNNSTSQQSLANSPRTLNERPGLYKLHDVMLYKQLQLHDLNKTGLIIN